MSPVTAGGLIAAQVQVERPPTWEKPGNEVGGRKMVTVCGPQEMLNKVKYFGFSFQLRMSLNYFGQKQGDPGKDHSLLEIFLSLVPCTIGHCEAGYQPGKETGCLCFDSSLSCDFASCSSSVKGAALLWEWGIERSTGNYLSACRWYLKTHSLCYEVPDPNKVAEAALASPRVLIGPRLCS